MGPETELDIMEQETDGVRTKDNGNGDHPKEEEMMLSAEIVFHFCKYTEVLLRFTSQRIYLLRGYLQ